MSKPLDDHIDWTRQYCNKYGCQIVYDGPRCPSCGKDFKEKHLKKIFAEFFDMQDERNNKSKRKTIEEKFNGRNRRSENP